MRGEDKGTGRSLFRGGEERGLFRGRRARGAAVDRAAAARGLAPRGRRDPPPAGYPRPIAIKRSFPSLTSYSKPAKIAASVEGNTSLTPISDPYQQEERNIPVKKKGTGAREIVYRVEMPPPEDPCREVAAILLQRADTDQSPI